MDDELEAPSSQLDSEKINASKDGDNNVEQFSDDEDGGPDWTKMPYVLFASSHDLPAQNISQKCYWLVCTTSNPKAWRERL